MPKRIQRRRTKGWRMPDGAVYVGRGTQWGNPIRIGTPNADDYMRGTREDAVAKYRYEIVQMNGGFVGFNRLWVRKHLRGKDLACWCPLIDKDGNKVPCHADVLLELANAPKEP